MEFIVGLLAITVVACLFFLLGHFVNYWFETLDVDAESYLDFSGYGVAWEDTLVSVLDNIWTGFLFSVMLFFVGLCVWGIGTVVADLGHSILN